MDLATLGIKLDSGGAVSGGAQVEAALNRVTTAADRAKKSLQEVKPDARAITANSNSVRDGLKDLLGQIDASKNSVAALMKEQNAAANNPVFASGIRNLVGTLNPYGIALGGVVAGVGAYVKATLEAEKQNFDLAKSIALTGNAMGVSVDKMRGFAEAISDVVGTRGVAVQALTAIASSGQVAGDNLEHFALVAAKLQATVGQPVAETAKIFAELGKDPVNASRKLNEQFGYLTASVYDQIAALQKRGDIDAAGEVAQKAYAEAANARVDKLKTQLGGLSGVISTVENSFAKMWNAVLNGTQADTLQKQLDKLVAQRGARQESVYGNVYDGNLDAKIASLQQAIKTTAALDKAEADATEANKVYIATLPVINSLLAEQQTYLQALAKSNLSIDIASIQRGLNTTKSAYANYNSVLEELHSAQLVSDKEFYAAKAATIQSGADAEVQAINENIARIKAANAAARSAFSSADHFDPVAAQAGAHALALQEQDDTKKINELLAKKAEISASAATALQLNSLKQADASRQEIKAMTEATSAAQAFLDVQKQQQERAINALGKGARQQTYDAGLNATNDKYAKQLLDLQHNKKDGPDGQKEYDRQLAVIKDFQAQALASYDDYWGQLTAKQSDFSVGIQQAVADYVDSASDIAGQTANLYTNAFSSMEDALVKFVQTGKLDFKSLADSIVADLLRIQIRALASKALSGLSGGGAGGWGSIFSSAGSMLMSEKGSAFDRNNLVTAFAKGGIVDQPTAFTFNGGQRGMMGEAGTEGILPLKRNARGQLGVMTNGGGHNVTINSTLNVEAGTNVAQFTAAMEQNNKRLKAELISDINRGVYGKVGS